MANASECATCCTAGFGDWDMAQTEYENCSVAIGIANESTPASVAALGRTGDLRGAGASGLDLDCVALMQFCFSAFLKHHQSGTGS